MCICLTFDEVPSSDRTILRQDYVSVDMNCNSSQVYRELTESCFYSLFM